MGWGLGPPRYFEKWVRAELKSIHSLIKLRAETDATAVKLAAEAVAEKFKNEMTSLYVRQANYREDQQRLNERLNLIEVCDAGVEKRKDQIAINTGRIKELEGQLAGYGKYILLIGMVLGAILAGMFQHFNK